MERLVDYAPNVASMFNHASLTTGEDWTAAYARIKVPTLVVHGELDPLLPLPNGEALARHIEGARLVVLPNTGHDLPPHALPALTEAVATHVKTNA